MNTAMQRCGGCLHEALLPAAGVMASSPRLTYPMQSECFILWTSISHCCSDRSTCSRGIRAPVQGVLRASS